MRIRSTTFSSEKDFVLRLEDIISTFNGSTFAKIYDKSSNDKDNV